MTGPLLKSAPLTHYHAVGAVGNPVYLAAAQLRAAISRRLGSEVADVFAVPQRSEDGATIDWYAPKPGTVVPWSSATETERAGAQQRLIEVRDQIETLGRSMEAEASPERQVFGRLLAQVMQFPDEQDVHLVNGSPVLSFWGFSRDRATVGSDPLRDLARHIASPEPGPAVRPRRPWWLWLLLALLALLLLAALLWALRGCENIELGGSEAPATPTGTDERRLQGGVSALETPPPEETVVAEEVDSLPQTLPEREPAAVDRTEIQRRLFDGTDRTTVVNRYGERVAVDGDAVGGDSGAVIDLGGEPVATRNESDLIDSDMADGEAVIDAADAAAAGDVGDTVDDPVDEAVADPLLPDMDGVAAAEDPSATAPEPDAAEDTSSAEATPDGDGSGDNAETDSEADAIATDADAVSARSDAPAETDRPADEADATLNDEDEGMASAPGDGGTVEQPEASAPAAAPNADGTTADAAATARAAASATPARIPARELLNSGWRTSTTLQDPKDGSPVRLDYRLRDGAGKVRLTRKDGSICETDAQGAVRAGRLVVDSRQPIVCADGTSFGKPQIDCSPRQDGKASCVGRYADGSSFPIDMERQAD